MASAPSSNHGSHIPPTPYTSTHKTTPSPVPDLVQFAVPPGKLKYPEYCFLVAVNFSQRLKDDPGVRRIIRILTGLLNTSGGIIEVQTHDDKPPDPDKFDKWKPDFEDLLISFIPTSIYHSCIQLINGIQWINIVVTKSWELITLNSNMYVRGMAGNRAVKEIVHLTEVMSQSTVTPCLDPFEHNSVLTYGQIVAVNEGPNIEHKYWKTVKKFMASKQKDTYEHRLQSERTARTLFALPNMPEGGCLIVGVEEDEISKQNKIRGQMISETDEANVAEFLGEFLQMDCDGKRRCWCNGSSDNYPRTGDWAIRFIPVIGGPPNQRRRVIVIQFKHSPGGVFMQYPESYFVSEEGFITKMDLQQWTGLVRQNAPELFHQQDLQTSPTIRLMSHVLPTNTNSRCVQQTTYAPALAKKISPATPTSCSQALLNPDASNITSPVSAAINVSSQQTPSTMPPTISTQASSTPGTSNLDPSVAANSSANSQPAASTTPTKKTHSTDSNRFAMSNVVSWAKNRYDWERNLTLSSLDLDKNAHKFSMTTRLFECDAPITLTPSRYTLSSAHGGFERMICYIENRRKAFGLATSEWASNLQTQSELKRPKHHQLDIFVVDETGLIELWAAVDEAQTDHRETWEYVLVSGRLTKRNLLDNRSPKCPSFRVNHLFVDCHVFQLGRGEVQSIHPENPRTQEILRTKNTRLNDLKLDLARTILRKNARLRNIFGDELSIVLTAEQMEIHLSLGLDTFNYIEGPPGSGKTYMALYLFQKHSSSCYMVPTQNLKKYLVYQGMPKNSIFLVEIEEDLLDLLDGGSFVDFDVLIFDDVQFVEFSDITWSRLFYFINEQKKKLFIYGDSRYQQFEPPIFNPLQVMQEFCKENPGIPGMAQKSLYVIHRNTRKIVSFMKANFVSGPMSSSADELSCSRPDDGDDVEVRYLQDIMYNGHEKENSLVALIVQLIDPEKHLSSHVAAYEPKDIAILVDTEEPEGDAILLRRIFKKNCYRRDIKMDVDDAGTFPVTGLTIDTLDSFVGFDRTVCILVSWEGVLHSKHGTGRTISNPRYKTFVASRGLSRVIFVVETQLSEEIASEFQFDKPPEAIRRLWHHVPNEYIPDQCYIDVAGQTAVLYVSWSDHALHTVSMTGEPLSIPVIPDMERPWRTASSSDGRRVVVAGWDDVVKGPWYWSVYQVQTGGRLERAQTYRLDTRPRAVCWTPDGHVIIILGKDGEPCTLARMSPEDGGSHRSWLWERGQTVTQLRVPARVAVCPLNGDMYVSDSDCIRVLSPDGYHSRDLPTAGISRPFAVCIASAGRSLFVADCEEEIHEDSKQRDVYLVPTDGGRPTKVLRAPGCVNNLRVQDRQLAVATHKGLVLYDVGDLG